jgi:hypothetical protein
MALLPVAWNAATLGEPDMASRTNAERNGCWTAGLDVRKAEETRVEAVREESCLEGAVVKACRSMLERAIDAIFARNGWMQADTTMRCILWSRRSRALVTSSDSNFTRGGEVQLDTPNFEETVQDHVLSFRNLSNFDQLNLIRSVHYPVTTHHPPIQFSSYQPPQWLRGGSLSTSSRACAPALA